MGLFDRFRTKSAEEIINALDDEEFHEVVLNLNKGKIFMVRMQLNITSNTELELAVNKRIEEQNKKIIAQNLLIISLTDDEKILKTLTAKNQDPQVRIAAINKINDDSFLMHFVKDERYHSVLKAAVDNINDQSLLVEIATNREYDISEYNNDSSARFYAVQNITDKDMIRKVIIESDEIKIYGKMIECIDDEDIIKELLSDRKIPQSKKDIIKSQGYKLYEKAIREYGDEDELMERLLDEDFDIYKKMRIISNLSEEKLSQFISKSSDTKLKRKAVENIENRDNLLDILKNTKNPALKRDILYKLKDSEISKDYAFDRNENVRKAAVKYIDDADILMEIIENDEDLSIREMAVKAELNDDMLKNIVMNNEYPDISKKAIRTIHNENILADIALSIEDRKLRFEAARRIKNKDIINKLHEKISLKTCPECGSFNVEYGNFYSSALDLFLYGYRCYNCGNEFETKMDERR